MIELVFFWQPLPVRDARRVSGTAQVVLSLSALYSHFVIIVSLAREFTEGL